ncbi:MAG TPA: hypothetical protein VGC15_23905, partial [Acetobacteraceae bacterium]
IQQGNQGNCAAVQQFVIGACLISGQPLIAHHAFIWLRLESDRSAWTCDDVRRQTQQAKVMVGKNPTGAGLSTPTHQQRQSKMNAPVLAHTTCYMSSQPLERVLGP